MLLWLRRYSMETGEGQIHKEAVDSHPAVRKAESAVAGRMTNLLPGESRVSAYAAWMEAITRAAAAREATTGEKLSKWGEFRASLFARYRAIAGGTKDIVYGTFYFPVGVGLWGTRILSELAGKIPVLGPLVSYPAEAVARLGGALRRNFRNEEVIKAQAYSTSQEAKYGAIRAGRAAAEVVPGAMKGGGELVKAGAKKVAEAGKWVVQQETKVIDAIVDRIRGKGPQTPQPRGV